MKFENKIKYNCVREAIIRYVLRSSNRFIDAIPWSKELESVIPWVEVYGKINNAFGSISDENGKLWDIVSIISKTTELVRFNEFITKKTNKIMTVYQGIIDKANALSKTKTVDDMMVNSNIADVANGIIANMFTKEYVDTIFNAIIEDVIADVKECADEQFSDDDVRLAVNRAILKKLGASI